MQATPVNVEQPSPKASSTRWFKSSPFLIMHLAVLAVFFVPFSPWLVALCAGSYFLRMFTIIGGYHRYFSHRSYKTSRLFQFCIALLGGTCVQKGALWWASNHRWHHRFSDTPQDVHSPVQRGFWWSHVGWILSDEHEETKWDQIPDLAKYPELRFLNTYHLLPPILYGTAFYLLGGWSALVWGFVVSTVLLWHGTFTINSLCHVWGSKRYQTTDESRNNFWLSLLTLGEGWHNNHHCYQSAARQGFFWWEIDVGYYTLRALSFIGLVSDLRQPPMELLEAKRIDRKEGAKRQSSDRRTQRTTPLHEVDRQPAAHF